MEESRTKDPIVKDIKKEPADVLDVRTQAMVKETTPTYLSVMFSMLKASLTTGMKLN